MYLPDKIESLHIRILKFLIYSIPLISLYISPSLIFPFITGKNFAFRILVELAAVLWISLIIVNHSYKLKNSIMTISIFTFALIAGVADLLGINPYKSFWSNYERMEGYITILHLVVYFAMVKTVLKTAREWKILFGVFLCVSVIVALLTFVVTLDQNTLSYKRYFIEYGTRAHSTIGNPPFLAAYLLSSVFFGLLLLYQEHTLLRKTVYLLAVTINAATVYITSSRGAILAGVLGISVFVILYIARLRTFHKRSLIKAAAAIIGVVILITAVFITVHSTDIADYDRTVSRFANMFSDPSVKSRLKAWEMAWNGFKERPFLGWGQENFIGVYTVNHLPEIYDRTWLDRPHNIIVEWLVNAGFPGVIAYLSIFLSACYLLWKSLQRRGVNGKEVTVLMIFMFVYFIQNLFLFDTVNTYLVFFTMMAYIDYLCSGRYVSDTVPAKTAYSQKRTHAYITTLASAILIFSVMFYFLNYKPIKQLRKSLQVSLSLQEYDSFSPLLRDFRNILSLNTFGNDDARKRMVNVSRVIIKNGAFDVNGAPEFIQETLKEVAKGLEFNRYNLEYLSDIIMFYRSLALYDPSFIERTEMLIRYGMRVNPDYYWLYMAMADVCKIKKDYDCAYANIKKIAERSPRNRDIHFKLALAAIYIDRNDLVQDALKRVKEIRMEGRSGAGEEPALSFQDLHILAVTYLETGKMHEALDYFKKIDSLPDEYIKNRMPPQQFERWMANLHYNMYKIYRDLGDEFSAASEAEKAAEYDPSYSDAELMGDID